MQHRNTKCKRKIEAEINRNGYEREKKMKDFKRNTNSNTNNHFAFGEINPIKREKKTISASFHNAIF